MSGEERATFLNVYLRPWTLMRSAATENVPYLCDLDMYAPGARSHRKAWRQYVRGGIVSDYAVHIIKLSLIHI
eukprot:2084820-Karenia_brevis.AAC.1